jgi:hypothetical protein
MNSYEFILIHVNWNNFIWIYVVCGFIRIYLNLFEFTMSIEWIYLSLCQFILRMNLDGFKNWYESKLFCLNLYEFMLIYVSICEFIWRSMWVYVNLYKFIWIVQCGSVAACGRAVLCCSVWQYGSARTVHAAVCGSVLCSVWPSLWQCAAVRRQCR